MAASRSKDRPQWARDLTSRVISLWEEARKEGYSHARILELYAERVKASPHWLQLTQYERAEVFATFHACSDMAYRRDIVWRLGPKDGPLPETPHGLHDWDEGSPLPTLARTPGELYGAHFWRGTDKPFNDYRVLNETVEARVFPSWVSEEVEKQEAANNGE